jgi:PadR family transcriptional regulator PadR
MGRVSFFDIYQTGLDKPSTLLYIVLGDNMEHKIRQLRKGILELAILKCLRQESHYGYSIIKAISEGSEIELTEGTIYPILGRLAKDAIVSSEWVESKQGPPRKYYSLTPKGKEVYDTLIGEFERLKDMVENVGRMQEDRQKAEEGKRIIVKKERKDEE